MSRQSKKLLQVQFCAVEWVNYSKSRNAHNVFTIQFNCTYALVMVYNGGIDPTAADGTMSSRGLPGDHLCFTPQAKGQGRGG